MQQGMFLPRAGVATRGSAVSARPVIVDGGSVTDSADEAAHAVPAVGCHGYRSAFDGLMSRGILAGIRTQVAKEAPMVKASDAKVD